MQVLAVSQNLLRSNSPQKNILKDNPKGAYLQNNILVDSNYGRSLVATKKVSFKGLSSYALFDLSGKVSTAFNSLRIDDLLVVGKDFDIAKKELKESINLFKDVVGQFIFIQDKKFSNTIFMKKSLLGFDEVGNLSERPLFLLREDKGTKNSLFLLKKGEASYLLDNDYVHVKAPEYGFRLKSSLNDEIYEIPDEAVKKFDFSASKKKNVGQINVKNLESIVFKETDAPEAKITFSDIGGQEDAISEIKQKIIFQLKYPNFFKNNKFQGIRSVLFVGPPGNGKSLAAVATANEAGVPFYNLNPQLLEGKYVGESAENIHNYYENVKNNQPCIIFFDEMDAIFKKRTGEHPYLDQSVNMHLDEISKLEKENAQVFLLGATNHPEIMDEAVLRNGRFGTKIEFKPPDTVEKCKAVLSIHIKNANIEDFDIDKFSKELLASKVNNADITAVVAEAKMNSAVRQGVFEAMAEGTFIDNPLFKLVINGEDFDAALKKINAQKSLVEGYSKTKVIRGFSPN